MNEVLLKALAYPMMILLGALLRGNGFFAPDDQRVVSNIVMNLTFPAAIISSMARVRLDSSLYAIIVLGILCSLTVLCLAYFLSRHNNEKDRALYMLNMPTYNIGMFTTPFVQSFLGPLGVAVTSLFDVGNALFATGGNYAAVSHALRPAGSPVNWRQALKPLGSSLPFLTYVAMIAIKVLGIPIPAIVTAVSDPVSSANAFLAMMMVGMMIRIQFDRSKLTAIAWIITVRLLSSLGFAAAFFWLLPYPLEVRKVLVLVAFSPVSGLSPMFTHKAGSDASVSSLAASLTILLSLAIMTTLILVMV